MVPRIDKNADYIPVWPEDPFIKIGDRMHCRKHRTPLLGRMGTSAGGGAYCLDCWKNSTSIQQVVENKEEPVDVNETEWKKLINWFSYHEPEGDDVEKYNNIRAAGLNLAEIILDNTPKSADQTAAIRKVREACFTANAAIACKGQ